MSEMRARQNVADLYPLTPLQQGILSHALRAEGDDPYLVKLCFRVRGPVDPQALRRAWQAVVDRHAALRADLEWVKTREPIQIVYRDCPVAIEELSWVGEPPAGEEARLAALLTAEAGRFRLDRAADRRILLVATGREEWLLVWVFHHVLLDGWSVANVLAEVLAAYRALAAGGAPDLAEAVPYARYLEWLRGQDSAAAEGYWREVLAGHDPVDFPPRAPDGAGFAERALLLDEAASDRLRELARRAHVTLATCFQAALALLVRAYTGREDVLFGATVAGRPPELAGSAAMVGAFINTLPVRARVRDDDAVDAWLQDLHREAGCRRAFEHLGLPRVQELAGEPGRSLFESILVFENFPVADALDQSDEAGLAVELHATSTDDDGVATGRGRNHYPLTVVVLPGRRIQIIVATHRDRVGDPVAAAMLDRLGAITRAMVVAPTVGAVLDAAARDEGLRGPPPAPPRAIHERIAGWAESTPDALAVRCEDRTLTYAELDRRANRLAAALRDRGAAAGARVGICLERSVDFVVALVAALRCGAAYVPLEPDHPRERLHGVIADARLAALVTRREHRPALDGLDVAIALVDELPDDPGESISAPVHPESPAYLIYTSGSTGRPKGVVVSHRALDCYVQGIADRLSLPPGASLAMASTVAADLGHTALFGALCRGGALHLLVEARAHDPDAFADYMEGHRVDALKIVPGHLAGLLDATRPERALPVHTLVLGGEAAPRDLVDRLRAQRRCRVINHYGPTETTVGVLTHELAGGDRAPLPLGRPLPGARVHVLGPDLRPMPAGAAGEIYIGGAGLAAGYFDRPGLTAERFVPDPFHSGPGGERLYRTGDRGRLRSDGAVEFLGRADDQVKVRGHRIELGEVQAALLARSDVRDARVLVRPGSSGTRLVAYAVGAGDTPAILDALRLRLPEPMVPSEIVWLDRLPVNANGKLDVGRLPDPAARTRSERAPAGEAERTLAAIWCEVLGRERVDAEDDFFQIGGDSILALKVIARARRAGLHLTPRHLHANRTLEQAARVAAPAVARTAEQPATGDALLTPIQLAFLARQTVDPHHFNQALLLEVAESVDLAVLERALALAARQHDALRLRFRRDGSGWRSWYAAEAPAAAIERIDLGAAASPAEAIERTCDRLQRGFDLERGPLLRAAHLDLGPGRGARLLLHAHHLVVDGVSWRILLEDLAEAAAALSAGREPELLTTTSFRRWTELLHQRAGSPELREELAHWQATVRAVPAAEPAGNTVADAAAVSDDLDEAETSALLARAPAAYGTEVHDLLLAALASTLCRAWRTDSALVAVEGHGREDLFDGVDLSRTVGWLSTVYPVRLAPRADRRATIAAVRDQLRRVPARGIGFGLLRHLAREPSLSGETPRVTFNYLGQFDPSFAGHSLFEIASESSGQRRSPASPREGWFVVNAVVYAGRLRVDWEYSRALHGEAEARGLLAAYLAELRAIVAGGAE